MRPSAQLSSVSGVGSKLGLTTIMPSLQSVPKPGTCNMHLLNVGRNFPVIDPAIAQAVCICKISVIFVTFLMPSDTGLRHSELTFGTPVTSVLAKAYSNCGFSTLYYFSVRSTYVTRGQRDRQTDGQARCVMRPIACTVCLCIQFSKKVFFVLYGTISR